MCRFSEKTLYQNGYLINFKVNKIETKIGEDVDTCKELFLKHNNLECSLLHINIGGLGKHSGRKTSWYESTKYKLQN